MKYPVRRLCESGILIAFALVLSMLKIFEFPFGGSITILSMLPIVLLSYRHGVRWGLFCGLIYSFLQMAVGINTISIFFLPGEDQMLLYKAVLMCLLDYVVAYTALGLGGLFRRRLSPSGALLAGSIVATFVCYVAHVLSGAIFFGSYAEWFFSDVLSWQEVLDTLSGGTLYVFYSIIYNGCYMLPEIVLTAAAGLAIGRVPFITENIKPLDSVL